jgi:hypothetical protein
MRWAPNEDIALAHAIAKVGDPLKSIGKYRWQSVWNLLTDGGMSSRRTPNDLRFRFRNIGRNPALNPEFAPTLRSLLAPKQQGSQGRSLSSSSSSSR